MLRIALCLVVSLSLTAGLPGPASFDPNPSISLTTQAAGASAGHAVSFRVDAGDLEIYRASVVYAAGFRVRGFHPVGPIGSTVGSFELDFDGNGTADRVLPLRSVSATVAYVDIIEDGRFSPDLEPAVALFGNTLDVRLPAGGDANVATRVAPFGCRVALRLLPEIIVNPALGGDYAIVARLTSVDPDTDGADDGAGSPPDMVRAAFPIHIDGPTLVPFTKLRVDRLDLKLAGANRDRLTISGRYLLGANSDGINRRKDDVRIAFASFSQTIPARAFTGSGPIREYKDRDGGPGVERMKLTADSFDIDVRGLHLIVPAKLQTFSLVIGNDVGSAVVAVPVTPGHDGKGRK